MDSDDQSAVDLLQPRGEAPLELWQPGQEVCADSLRQFAKPLPVGRDVASISYAVQRRRRLLPAADAGATWCECPARRSPHRRLPVGQLPAFLSNRPPHLCDHQPGPSERLARSQGHLRCLGHASVGITVDTYSHVLPAADRETADTLAR